MIKLDNISFQYGASHVTEGQLKNISLHVKPGEFILLTGQSGCGKTTLTRILNGLCPQFYSGTITGEYLLDGRDARNISINEIGTIVGSVFQDPRSQFFTSNTTDEIVLSMENNALQREEQQKRLRETASQIGVENILNRSIFSLSSGEKQRVAIASVCAMRPKVLVLDEPSANLDSDTVIRLSNLLFRLKEAGTTIILSEHRLHYVRDFFDRMILMEEGSIKVEYNHEQALALSNEQLHDLGLRIFDASNILSGKRVITNAESCLYAKKLSISFNGQKVLDEIELCAEKGKILTIMGGNGAGKTTLCRILTGLNKQNIGQVFMSEKITKRRQRIKSSFFVQQDSDYQLYAPTVEDEFRIGKSNKVLSRSEVETSLENVGLKDVIDRHPISLSGGQKQRLLLALAAVSTKEILVLDEPTSGLDGYNMRLTAELLKKMAQKGHCVILITHDLELIKLASDSLLYMDKGKVVYHRNLK